MLMRPYRKYKSDQVPCSRVEEESWQEEGTPLALSLAQASVLKEHPLTSAIFKLISVNGVVVAVYVVHIQRVQ